MRSCGGQAGFQPIVFGAHKVRAVHPFQPAHGEVAPRHILEMLDESEVDGRAAQSAEHGNRLRRHLLRDDDPEP